MIFILTSSNQILYPKIMAEEPRTNELIHSQLSWEVEELLGSEESYQEQQGYLRNAAHAAYVSLNILDQENHFRLKADLEVVQGQEHAVNLIQGSSSSGLGFSLAVFSTWWTKVLQKSNWPTIPIFATGEVSPSGQIMPINHIKEKLQAVCNYAQKNNLKQFYVCFPQSNHPDIPEELTQEVSRLGGELFGAERLAQLLEAILGEQYDGDPLGKWQPFKGLKSFEFNDAMRFFGRDQEVLSLESDLQNNQGILFVVGASGSGKSSLIKAGLIPKLKAENPELKWAQIKPSELPKSQGIVDYLIELLAQIWQLDQKGFDTKSLITNLGKPQQLENTLRQLKEIVEPQQQNVLVYLDQFEEVFSDEYNTGQSLSEELAWLETITRYIPQLKIILAIRNEYLSLLLERNALNSPVISAIKSDLKTEQWQEIVQKQTHFSGLKFEEGLDKLIINDAVNTPYALPMVEYVLEQLYLKAIEEEPISTLLKTKHYRELGGLSGIIAKQASLALEQGVSGLTDNQAKQLISTFFKAFIGEDDSQLLTALNPTREILQDAFPLGIMSIVNAFIDKGLIVNNGQQKKSSLRLAHDTLLNIDTKYPHWPELIDWYQNNQDYLKWYRRINGSFQEWLEVTINNKTVDSELYLNPKQLEIAQGFIDTSAIKDQRLLTFIEMSRRHLLHQQQIRTRKVWFLGFVFLLLFIGASIAGWNAYQNQLLAEAKEKEKNTALIEANHNYALALNEKVVQELEKGNHDLAKLYAINALVNAKNDKLPTESISLLASEGIELNNIFVSQLNADINSVAISSDGKSIVSGSSDHIVRVWDLQSGQYRELKGHTAPVNSVAISADGNIVVSGSYDKTVRVWNLETGESQELKGYYDTVNGVFISADGTKVVFKSWNSFIPFDSDMIHIWDLERGQSQEFDVGHIRLLAVSPDATTLVLEHLDHKIRVWNLESASFQELKGHSNDINVAAISSDGKTVVSASADNTILFWDLESGQSKELNGHQSDVSSVSISADGKTVVAGSKDNTVRVWNLKNGKSKELNGHKNDVSSVSISSDGKTVVSGSRDNTVRVWDITFGKSKLEGHQKPVESIAISSNGKTLVSGSYDRAIRIWDLESGQPSVIKLESHWSGNNPPPIQVALSSDGKTLAYGSWIDRASIFNLETTQSLAIKGYQENVNSVSISPEGQFTVSGTTTNSIQIWDVKNNRRKTLHSESYINSVAITPDAKKVIYGDSSNMVQIWNLQNAKPTELKGHSGAVFSISISADSKTVVSGSEDNTVRVWNLKSGQSKELNGHRSAVFSVSISSDGKKVISGSRDNTIRVWDLESGQSQELNGNQGNVRSVVISSDGKTALTAGGSDNTIQIWDLTFLELVKDKAKLKEIAQQMATQTRVKLNGLNFENDPKIFSNLHGQQFTKPNWPKHHPMYWLPKAEKGDSEAYLQLGIIEHRDRNWNKAKEWYLKAKRAGHKEADYRLKILEKHKFSSSAQ